MAMADTPKCLFDPRMEDIMVNHVTKYLGWEDLLEFRSCSRSCRDLADKMFKGLDRLFVYVYHDPASGYSFVFRMVRELKMIGLGGLDWLKDDLLAKLLKNSPSLEVFYIANCHRITGNGILPLATHCPKLRHMILRNTKVGDNFLHTFSLYNKQLETLDLAENKDLTPRWLDRFIGKQPLLRNINLDDIMFIPIRRTLKTIGRKCNNVEYLSFNNCKDVNDDIVIQLADTLPKIRAIRINIEEDDDDEDPEFTERSVEYLESRRIDHKKPEEILALEAVLDEPKKAFLATFSYP